jgi:hypothetical protein
MIYLTCFAVFLLVGAAIFLVGGLDKKIADEMRRGKKAGAMKLRKETVFTRLARLVREVNMPPAVYTLLTVFCAGVGAAVGKLLFSHMFFAVAVGILGAFSPQLFLRIKLTQTNSQRVERLYSSMLILSNSYIVTEDFIQSVRDNLGVLEYSAPFRDFLTYTNYIDSSVKTGLRRMEAQVNNDYFSQWINVLILAQDDRNMKYVTMSVVDAMADVRQAQRESDTAMYAIWREYFTVLSLIFAAPLIFRVLMRDAYTALVTTLPGQALLTLLLAAVVFSLVRAYRLNKPLLT